MSYTDILSRLISYKSVSPSDDGAINYIKDLLEKAGFRCHVQIFGKDEEQTTNLYAEYGDKGANLCFAGHVDVVPAGLEESWKYPPYIMTTQEDRIYGRGVVDMKGALACMIEAGLDHARAKSREKLSFLITSDEEGSAEFGTRRMLEWMQDNGHKIDFAIIGEPTCDEEFGDIIKVGRRGSINFALEVRGEQGHVAYPEKAQNPHKNMVKILSALQNYDIDMGDAFFAKSNLEITSVDTNNSTTNLIPSRTKAKFNIRCSGAKKPSQIIQEIENMCSAITQDFDLKYKISALPFLAEMVEFTEIFQKIVISETGSDGSFGTSGGTSDARFIKDYCPLLEFGLLNETAHKVDENTKITHLQKLYNVYSRAIKSFHRI
ncbi:MAG: succinyl-diaminopimelate desuccinylase [Rickettsiaceae bacterium]|nr:succinyl-diaminopimelate desuccinylase [Rickettsiaceae bacterium]